jgi:hypothetical protein
MVLFSSAIEGCASVIEGVAHKAKFYGSGGPIIHLWQFTLKVY